MSISQDTDPIARPSDIPEYRKWFIIVGALLVLLGLLAIVAAFAVTMATVILFGILVLVAGLAQMGHAFSASLWRGFMLHLLAGILYTAVGVLMIADPVRGAIGITLLLALFFVFGGCLKIILAMQVESGWFGITGALNLLLGLLVLLGWPGTGTWVIGLFLGIEMLFAGLSLLLLQSAKPRLTEP